MKLAVIGSRNFNDYDLLKQIVDEIPSITLIVSGAARGADTLGEKYANEKGIPTKIFPAERHDLSHPDAVIRKRRKGKFVDINAGYRRNLTIIDNVDMIIAFWDEQSAGTKHALDYAEEQKKKVKIVKFQQPMKEKTKLTKGLKNKTKNPKNPAN